MICPPRRPAGISGRWPRDLNRKGWSIQMR